MNDRFGRVRAALLALAGVLSFAAFMPAAASAAKHDAGDESQELMEGLEWFTNQRAYPAEQPPAAAWPAAVAKARATAAVDTTGWSELGPYKYFTDDGRYVSQPFSNNGSGSGFNTGRITTIAATSDGKVIFAGAAGGGVWKTTDGGGTWTPLTDTQDTLSTGTLTVVGTSRSYTLYVGTGESNTNSDSYAGVGILKSTDGGASFSRVGGSELVGANVFRILADGSTLYAATSHGLYRSSGGTWTPILGGTHELAGGGQHGHRRGDQARHVRRRPPTSSRSRGWREGASTNGLYESKNGGASFTALSPQGYVPAADQGRTTLQFSRTGDRLYAEVQSPKLLAAGSPDDPGRRLRVAHRRRERPVEPDRLAEQARELRLGDEARRHRQGLPARRAGLVQPVHRRRSGRLRPRLHRSGGGLRDDQRRLELGDRVALLEPDAQLLLAEPVPGHVPNTTHSDQHGVAIAGGKVFVGNDGGVFSRSLSTHTAGGGWSSLNARLGTLQYYYADSGATAVRRQADLLGRPAGQRHVEADARRLEVHAAGGHRAVRR